MFVNVFSLFMFVYSFGMKIYEHVVSRIFFFGDSPKVMAECLACGKWPRREMLIAVALLIPRI